MGQAAIASEPYTEDDVMAAFHDAIKFRSKAARANSVVTAATSAEPFPQEILKEISTAVPHARKHSFEAKKVVKFFKDDKDQIPDVWACLEEACGELKIEIEELHDMLESCNFSSQLIDLVMKKVGCEDPREVIAMLEPQRQEVLRKIKRIVEQKRKAKSDAEKEKGRKIQEKLRRLGMCPMVY